MRNSESVSVALLKIKNDVISTWPAVMSNIEDFVFRSSDRVCEFKVKAKVD